MVCLAAPEGTLSVPPRSSLIGCGGGPSACGRGLVPRCVRALYSGGRTAALSRGGSNGIKTQLYNVLSPGDGSSPTLLLVTLRAAPRPTWREGGNKPCVEISVETVGSYSSRRTLLPLPGSFLLFSSRGAPTVAAAAAAALTPERCPGLPSPMQNLTAPGGPGNSNVTCSCNCTASQPQGMEICEYRTNTSVLRLGAPGRENPPTGVL